MVSEVLKGVTSYIAREREVDVDSLEGTVNAEAKKKD